VDEAILPLAFVSLLVLEGIAIRAGRMRNFEPWLSREGMPILIRNGALAILPLGVGFAFAVAILFLPVGGRLVVVVGVVAIVVAIFIALYVALRAPMWARPLWMRSVRLSQRPTSFDIMITAVMVVVCAGLLFSISVVLVGTPEP